MKVPDELVEAGLKAAYGERAAKLAPDSAAIRVLEAHLRMALEAVLPKLRERLLNKESLETVCRSTVSDWRPDYSEHTPEGEVMLAEISDAIILLFDQAFPDEEATADARS